MKKNPERHKFIRYCMTQKMSLAKIGSLLQPPISRQRVHQISKTFRKEIEAEITAKEKIKVENYIKKHGQRELYDAKLPSIETGYTD